MRFVSVFVFGKQKGEVLSNPSVDRASATAGWYPSCSHVFRVCPMVRTDGLEVELLGLAELVLDEEAVALVHQRHGVVTVLTDRQIRVLLRLWRHAAI